MGQVRIFGHGFNFDQGTHLRRPAPFLQTEQRDCADLVAPNNGTQQCTGLSPQEQQQCIQVQQLIAYNKAHQAEFDQHAKELQCGMASGLVKGFTFTGASLGATFATPAAPITVPAGAAMGVGAAGIDLVAWLAGCK